MPNDDPESDRLDLANRLFQIVMDDKLHLAPIQTEFMKKVLNVRTGTGIWAIEMG